MQLLDIQIIFYHRCNSCNYKGPSTLATSFLATSGRVFVADPSTLGRHVAVTAKFRTLLSGCHMPHEQSLVCSLRTQPQKRSVCGGDEPQPVAHLSHKLQCARQSLKIMVFLRE